MSDAPEGQLNIAQGSALGEKFDNMFAPCKGNCFKTMRKLMRIK